MRLHNPENYELLGFEVNKGKKHKYLAILENKKTKEKLRVPFGGKHPDGTPYEQYHDKIGHYSEYDHNDPKRRDAWLKRHKANISYKYSSAWWSWKYLW